MINRGFMAFLALVTVGAIVAGVSLVLIKDFPVIVAHLWENNRTTHIVQSLQTQNEQEESSGAVQLPDRIVLSELFSNPSSQTLTRSEEEQVWSMLKSLGISGETFAETMKAYQSDKSLEVTGALTIETLEAIIRDFTVSRVSTG